MGNIIVLLILAVLVFFAARSLYRSHKAGGGCGGDCGSCGGCGCGGDSCQCESPEINMADLDNDKKA